MNTCLINQCLSSVLLSMVVSNVVSLCFHTFCHSPLESPHTLGIPLVPHIPLNFQFKRPCLRNFKKPPVVLGVVILWNHTLYKFSLKNPLNIELNKCTFLSLVFGTNWCKKSYEHESDISEDEHVS